jgi:DNA polymerase-1
VKTSYNTLYLVDISSFIFRAFYAVRELTAPDGTPVNAVYGVATMLGRLIEEADPRYLAIVFDSKEPSFRKLRYPEYKANRSAPPEMLLPQFDLIEKLIEVMGIPAFRQSGVEADDLIATLNRNWIGSDPRHRTVIVSGDKDLMALVNSKTQLWDTMKEVHYTPHEVIEKFGVEPGQVRDYLAMVGDSSDNIPGITGIGPKGAEQLLREFGTLEGVIEAAKAGRIKGKKGEMIVEGEGLARLSQELATLKEDIPLSLTPEQARFEFKVTGPLLDFVKHYNFRSLQSKYASIGSAQGAPVEVHPGGAPATVWKPVFKTVSTETELEDLLGLIRSKGRFAFDTETTSLDPRKAKLVGIAIAVDGDGGFYIPVGHELTLESRIPQLDPALVIERLKPMLESEEIGKIGQNLKYDARVMLHQGVRMRGIEADTMVAAYALDSSGRHNLDFLAKKHLSYDMKTYEEVTGKGASQIGFEQVSIEEATRYSAEDAWAAFLLWEKLKPEVERTGVDRLFRDVDLPMVGVVADMEETGIRVDAPFLKKLESVFEGELRSLEGKILSFSKNPSLNLNSTKQLAGFLFEELKLPPQSKTKTGYSTDASVLEALAPMHEAPKLLLEYREISKLKGTYVIPLQELRDPVDSRIRTSFHLTGTATGRLSSSDPNLQNIPTRSKRGQMIREAFVAGEGSKLLSADYSQIELRILAHLSGDPVLCESFRVGEDVHRRTASGIFKKDPSRVTDEERAFAKAINFGLMYGKTVFGLAEELHIPRSEAKSMIESYFARYSGVKCFLENQVASARENGFVSTLLGRKRMLPELRSSNPAVRANAERMAMNSPIQGTASDLIKVAMVRLHRELGAGGFASKMLLQVHDELLLECPLVEVERAKSLVTRVMEGAIALEVPLVVNVGVGERWSEL